MPFGCFRAKKIGIEKAHTITTTKIVRNNPSMQYLVRMVPQFHGWYGVVLKKHGANVHLIFSRVSVTDRISLAVPIIPISCPQHSFRVVTFGLVIWQVWQLIIVLFSFISLHFVFTKSNLIKLGLKLEYFHTIFQNTNVYWRDVLLPMFLHFVYISKPTFCFDIWHRLCAHQTMLPQCHGRGCYAHASPICRIGIFAGTQVPKGRPLLYWTITIKKKRTCGLCLAFSVWEQQSMCW